MRADFQELSHDFSSGILRGLSMRPGVRLLGSPFLLLCQPKDAIAPFIAATFTVSNKICTE
jgi:hypothetical protein